MEDGDLSRSLFVNQTQPACGRSHRPAGLIHEPWENASTDRPSPENQGKNGLLQHSFKMPITTTKLSKNNASRQCSKHHRLVTLFQRERALARARPWTEAHPAQAGRASTHGQITSWARFPWTEPSRARPKGSTSTAMEISGTGGERQGPEKIGFRGPLRAAGLPGITLA